MIEVLRLKMIDKLRTILNGQEMEYKDDLTEEDFDRMYCDLVRDHKVIPYLLHKRTHCSTCGCRFNHAQVKRKRFTY